MAITRADVKGLIPKEYLETVFGAAVDGSAVLKLGTRLRDMNASELELAVQDTLPVAGFVRGDAGLKSVSDMKWRDKKIVAEEIAVIVPIPDNIVEDAKAGKHDLWELIKPQLTTAFGKVIDEAILYGTNKPSSWEEGIVPTAIAKGNFVTQSSDKYADIMGVDGLIAKVEEDGFMVNGYIASMKSRAYLRSITTATEGIPLFRSILDAITGRTTYTIDGERLEFPLNGAVDGVFGNATAKPYIIGGDFSQLVYSIREDIKFEIFTEGVISNSDGVIVMNLMQQDSSALRVKMRLGWALPNPVNHINGTASRYPFSLFIQSATGSLGAVTATSAAGTTTGDSLITITSAAKETFNTFWYKADKTSVAAPTLGDNAAAKGYTKMTLTTGAQNIAFTEETKIRVAEVDIYGRIIGVTNEVTLVKNA